MDLMCIRIWSNPHHQHQAPKGVVFYEETFVLGEGMSLSRVRKCQDFEFYSGALDKEGPGKDRVFL